MSDTAGKIAGRYRGRAGILAYDIKNEPRFNDIALSRYASAVPLQRRDLVDTFGERLPRAELADFRATDEGRRDIPPNLTDDEAWPYINGLRLYREMLAEASAWVRERGFRGTTLDYLNDAAGQKWAPLRSALDASLKAWLTPQVDAIRRGDPVASDHGASRRRRAGQPARQSDRRLQHAASLSEHGRGVGASDAGADQDASGRAQRSARTCWASSATRPTRSILSAPRCTRWRSSSGLLSQNAAGGAKWMLNDMPEGFNMRERTLGAFRLDGSPKPIVGAMAALRAYLASSGSGPGDLRLEDDPEVGLRYVYRASDALFMGGKRVDAGAASFEAGGPAQVFVTLVRARGAARVGQRARRRSSST